MVTTNDDILAALNKLIELQPKRPIEMDSMPTSNQVFHDGVEVEYNIEEGKYYPKVSKEII